MPRQGTYDTWTFISRLTKEWQANPRPPAPFQLRAESSYLIVGGLSGIGIEIAKWMVHERGAKSLILISRSGMDTKGATDAVEALKRPGVIITVRKCDVTDMDGLSSVLDECAQRLPPIRGVVQGAMVLKVNRRILTFTHISAKKSQADSFFRMQFSPI